MDIVTCHLEGHMLFYQKQKLKYNYATIKMIEDFARRSLNVIFFFFGSCLLYDWLLNDILNLKIAPQYLEC